MKKITFYILFFLCIFCSTLNSQNNDKIFEGNLDNEFSKRYESQQKAYRDMEAKHMQELIEASDDYYKKVNKKQVKKAKRKDDESGNTLAKFKAEYDAIMPPEVIGIGKEIDISREDFALAQSLFGSGISIDAGILYRVEEYKRSTVYQRSVLIDKIIPVRLNNDNNLEFGQPICNIFKLFYQICNSVFS